MADGDTSELGRIALKRTDLFRQQCYISGKWVGEPSVEVRNPATFPISAAAKLKPRSPPPKRPCRNGAANPPPFARRSCASGTS